MINLKAVGLGIALAAVAPSLIAQEIPSAYRFVETRQEAGVFFGRGLTGAGQLGLGPLSGDVLGGRYTLEFGSALGLEANLAVLKSERDVHDIRRDEGDQVIGRADGNVTSLDLRIRLNLTGHRTWRGLQPFILFGGGLAFGTGWDRTPEFEAEIPPMDVYEFGTRFMATVGGGMAFHVSRRLVLRVDGVLALWKVATPDGYLDANREITLDRTLIPDGEWVAVRSLSIGTSWRF